MDTSRIQKMIDLVHKRDELVEQRTRLTSAIDTEIAEIDRMLLGAATEGGEPQTRSDEAEDDGTADKAYAFLSANPGADFGRIATELYGTLDASTREKARAVVYYLKKQGRVQASGKRGAWEVKPPDA